MLSRTVSIIYTGSFVTLSLATTSRNDGPVNLSVRSADDPELPDEDAGASAPLDALACGWLCILDGRDDGEPDSDWDVSSLRSDGNLEDVDIRDGLEDWGCSSCVEQPPADLLPSKKGVMKDPLTIAVERGKTGERW